MLTKTPLAQLMQEAAELHKRWSSRTPQEVRFNIVTVARTLKQRRG